MIKSTKSAPGVIIGWITDTNSAQQCQQIAGTAVMLDTTRLCVARKRMTVETVLVIPGSPMYMKFLRKVSKQVEYFLGTIFTNHKECDYDEQCDVQDVWCNDSDEPRWYVSLDVNGTQVKFKVDTGADTTVMPESEYRRLKTKPKLNASKAVLTL